MVIPVVVVAPGVVLTVCADVAAVVIVLFGVMPPVYGVVITLIILGPVVLAAVPVVLVDPVESGEEIDDAKRFLDYMY